MALPSKDIVPYGGHDKCIHFCNDELTGTFFLLDCFTK
jgi:hypothetical protein